MIVELTYMEEPERFLIVHCSEKSKKMGVYGQPINATKEPVTKEKAQLIHRAIMVRKGIK